MTYIIGVASQDGVTHEKTVIADEVSYDPHWVSFRRTERPPAEIEMTGCDDCGRAVTRPRMASASRVLVAAYPAQKVRYVEMKND